MPDGRLVVLNLDEDDGDLYDEIFDNLPEDVYVSRSVIAVVIQTLVALDYDVVWYDNT